MAKRVYDEDDEDEEKDTPTPSYDTEQKIDPTEKVDCVMILKLGLPIMLNEVRRLKNVSEEKGLSGRGAGQITKYLETASSILKAHKTLNINPLTEEDLNKMPEQELADLVIKAASQLGFDGTDLNVVKKARGTKTNEN